MCWILRLQSAYPCTGCSSCGLLTSQSGSLSDGSGSNNYPNNANCRWVIAPTGATQITLTISSLATENNYDFVTVSQCTSSACSSTTELAKLSGTLSSSTTRTSTTGYMLVTFTSDTIVDGGGFSATWTSNGQVRTLLHFVLFYMPMFMLNSM